jgi:phosphonate transport system permease protein
MTTTEAVMPARPVEPLGPKIFRWVVIIGVIGPLIWSAMGLGVSWDRVLNAPARIWRIVSAMFPPNLSPEVVQRAMPKVMESLLIAWVGTMIAAVISLPLALLAARNVANKVVSPFIRGLFIVIRTIPEIVLAMFLIPVAGLGPWVGTLAIGIHSVGTLGKLSTEVIEGIDQGPVDAVAGVGGGRFSGIRFGVLPQVMPTILAYWLYRFEINVRASAVIGIVGAGGIGLELQQQLGFGDFPRVGTVLLLVIGVVLASDTISSRLRRRIITGIKEPGPVAVFQKARSGKRITMVLTTAAIVYAVAFILMRLQG